MECACERSQVSARAGPRRGTPAIVRCTLRFVSFGAVAFTVFGVLNAIFSFRAYNAVTRFTSFAAGQEQLLTYAFATMVLFGAAYFVLPRLTGSLWPSAKLVHVHFWSTALGAVASIVASRRVATRLSADRRCAAKIPNATIAA